MRLFQLRTYHLRTAEAAKFYISHWERHVSSLRNFGVETRGFFSVPATPEIVMALVSMDDQLDPELTREELQIINTGVAKLFTRFARRLAAPIA